MSMSVSVSGEWEETGLLGRGRNVHEWINDEWIDKKQ